jgi:hypothetical protein
MTVTNKIHDNKINADNYIINVSIEDYYDLIKEHLNDNEYQRKRVKNSKSIYSQLKSDLIEGCIMPPIVLAYTGHIDENMNILDQLRKDNSTLIILDGLQRSYTIKEIVLSYQRENESFRDPLKNKIRVEVYSGINKLGILYRMLTLNTGQTQMTLRHQIEIVYSDFKRSCGVEGVTMFTEVEGKTPNKIGEYSFRDVVDGFTSYLQKDYLTIDRLDMLDTVTNLKRLLSGGDNNLFDNFLSSYHNFVCVMNKGANDSLENDIEKLDLNRNPFAKNACQMFNKSQSLTGYGCALASLMDLSSIKSFNDIEGYIKEIDISSVHDGLILMIQDLDYVANKAKKIGNDQRLYFKDFFKGLFDNQSESFGNIERSAKYAMNQYIRVTE